MKIMMMDVFLPYNAYTLELCDKLGMVNKVILFCTDRFIPSGNERYQVCPIFHSKSKKRIDAFFLYLRDLYRIYIAAKKEKPDVIHYQGVRHVYIETILFRILRNKGIKIFYTAHNILSHEEKKHEKKKLNYLYRCIDGIIVHNECCKKMLLESSDYQGKVFVVPHGSYDIYSARANKKTKELDKTVFLQFGIIRHYKGVDILIEAVHNLPSSYLNRIKVIIAGAIKKEAIDCDLEKQIKDYKLEQIIQLIPTRISDDDIPDLFNNSDCCVFPYRQIYGSGALLMAYTFNKPVIVSDLPVFLEETENEATGLAFENNNPKELAKAMIRFVDMGNEDKTKKAKAVSRIVKDKYNWVHAAQLTENAYSTCINAVHNT